MWRIQKVKVKNGEIEKLEEHCGCDGDILLSKIICSERSTRTVVTGKVDKIISIKGSRKIRNKVSFSNIFDLPGY